LLVWSEILERVGFSSLIYWCLESYSCVLSTFSHREQSW